MGGDEVGTDDFPGQRTPCASQSTRKLGIEVFAFRF